MVRVFSSMLLWSFFTVMPGMLVLISPSKHFWGQVLGFSLSHNSWVVYQNVNLSLLMLFDHVVQTFSFEPILGEVLKPVVQWMVWQPLHLFSMGEKLCLSSALKRLNSGCFFHYCNWSTFHGSEDCS